MEARKLQQLETKRDGSLSVDGEAQMSSSSINRGGWITFPFIMAILTGITLTGGGWSANLIVYLIEEFHVKSITAAQISNVVNGCSCVFPVIGAIVADSFLGCFSVVSISAFISFLVTVSLFSFFLYLS